MAAARAPRLFCRIRVVRQDWSRTCRAMPNKGHTTVKASFKKAALRSATCISAVAILHATAVQAQDAPAEESANTGDVIIVTGSRIARPDLTAASPVSVLSSEQMQIANKPGVEEILRRLPQAVAGLGSSNNNGNEGTATVNLRNLGEERTLVLVDGKRFVPYDAQGIVDLNMIPSALIERVEVVTGGASAVYGSDAVAGVVNFIMKKNFTGIQGDAQYGISDRGDGSRYDFSLTGGINLGDRGNITVNGTYSKQQKVTQGQRSFSNTALASADLSASGGSSTNLFGSIDTPDGRFTFTPTGLQPYSAARDSFNFNPYNLLQVPQEKWTATALAHYDLTDAIEFFGRASYGHTKVQTEIAPSGTFGFSFDINYLTNPALDPALNPAAAGARELLATFDTDNDGIVNVGVRRRTTEVGPRISAYDNKAMQFVGGLRGDIGSSLRWETFAQYGKTKRSLAYLNDLDANKVQQALLADSTGCLDPSNGCSPANLFGAGNLSPEAAKFISFSLSEKDEADQFVAGANLTGDLPFELVSGKPAAFAVGVEYRRETAQNRPDINLITGNSIGFGASSPIDAKISVREIYGELNVPLLADMPFVQQLGLEGGFRYSDYKNSTTVDTTGSGGTVSHYSNSFQNWTFKIGADWKPVDAVRFRAMFQRAVRAPNLYEIGLPQTSGTGDALFDPCDSTVFPAAATATLDNLCRTVGGGLPAGVNPGEISPPTSGQVNNFSGGNPDLVPEKANTITIGAVLEPGTIPGLTASIDYFDIEVKNAILETPEQAILDACYFGEQDANGLFCSFIHRSQIDGSLEGDTIYGVESIKRNIGKKTARGIDLAVNYSAELVPDVRLLLAFNGTWTMDSKVQFAKVLNTYECAGKVGKTCLDPQPKWVWNQTTGIEISNLLFQLTWRHLSSLENDAFTVGYYHPARDYVKVPKIGSFDYFDLALRANIQENLQFRLGVDNLFDKKPPVVGNDYGGTTQNSGNTYPATYDTLGRFFTAGVNVKF